MASIINRIFSRSLLVFVVVVFAQLEFLMEKLLTSKTTDLMLFDTPFFDRVCESAGLTAKEKETFTDHRCMAGVMFANDAIQIVPRDAVLPFFRRNSLGKYGSSGSIFQVEIPGLHHSKYPDDSVRSFFAYSY